ncbi:bifunctional glycosyltransferase family 2/GtrA family protein [Paenibacillus sp. LHD-117]|uniref:bifunctional glycosyltransferase family 2/GtrA family protein n=1 Tax=Paenibacillus sp. LHD-117 TaxID=3071412 RepID=UPI0027DEF121|nr:bifunctional glycosyltransferase family 2/GtrA family protein [Paenibacillus sp. LHD-117]MDQ6423450.1 bifunctional glycosyltransferase family 2/GtrA family protein [Paenibacillus sp. LHD-117]
MTILIPSYEPDERLIALIRNLKEVSDDSILIVDDGSGEDYRDIFESAKEAGCTVLTHRINLGKGSALKTGFDYVRQHGDEDGIVCADSDGQHLPGDILRIVHAVREHRNHIVLGSRQFTGKVPLRSRFGNSATRMVFAYATGKPIQDTQTGLRGYSSDMLDWLCQVPGDRFEYEMNMLLEAPSAGYELVEVPIDTVYLDENKSSHFRPLADSARVYFPFLKFCTSSGFAAVLDFALLLLLQWLTSNLLVSVIGARVCSSIFNYAMNRRFVFAGGKGAAIRKSLPRYYSLVLIIVALNYAMLHLLHVNIGVPLVAAKLMTEASLFVLSYWAQRKFVY